MMPWSDADRLAMAREMRRSAAELDAFAAAEALADQRDAMVIAADQLRRGADVLVPPALGAPTAYRWSVLAARARRLLRGARA